MGHGSGGKMTQEIIEEIFYPHFSCLPLAAGNDFAAVGLPDTAMLEGQLSISTDAHSVAPLIFPGGTLANWLFVARLTMSAWGGAAALSHR
jgi:hydrogenase expression/formation protein HypE